MGDAPARITVRVQPKAKRSEVVAYADGVLKVRVAAVPEKGRANQELVRLLAEVLGVPRSAVTIERGATSRTKLVRIEGLSDEEVGERVCDER
jgi:uncharacterized protein (TIGR00251 family)